MEIPFLPSRMTPNHQNIHFLPLEVNPCQWTGACELKRVSGMFSRSHNTFQPWPVTPKISEKNWTGVPLQLASHLVTGDISFTHSFFYGFTEVLFDVMLNDIEYDVKQNSQYVIKESVNEVNLVSGSLTPHLPGAPGQGFSWSSGGSWVTGWYLKWALRKFCGSLIGRRADVRAYGRAHGPAVIGACMRACPWACCCLYVRAGVRASILERMGMYGMFFMDMHPYFLCKISYRQP